MGSLWKGKERKKRWVWYWAGLGFCYRDDARWVHPADEGHERYVWRALSPTDHGVCWCLEGVLIHVQCFIRAWLGHCVACFLARSPGRGYGQGVLGRSLRRWHTLCFTGRARRRYSLVGVFIARGIIMDSMPPMGYALSLYLILLSMASGTRVCGGLCDVMRVLVCRPIDKVVALLADGVSS